MPGLNAGLCAAKEALLRAVEGRKAKVAALTWNDPARLPVPKRNHPKRHSENRERAIAARAKHKRSMAIVQEHVEERQRHAKAMAAYWRGEAIDLSGI